MWSTARWILRNSPLKRVYQVTSSNVILRFCFSSQCHPFGSVKSGLSRHFAIQKFPADGTFSPQAGSISVGMLCWACLFFVRCMRPHFSELFRSKLSGKSARRVSRARAVNTTIAGLCISSIQRSVKQSPSVLVLQTARAAGLNPSSVQLHHCCSWAGTANLPRAREHLCVRLCECQSGVLLAVLFGDSLTKAVSARALSGSSHHSSTTLLVLSLGLLSMRTEIANPNLMMLCPGFVIQSPSPAVPPDNPAHIVFMANIF